MSKVEIGENDWGFIARGGKGQIELYMPIKEEFDSSEIIHVLLGVKRFETALLEVMADEADETDGRTT